MIIAAPKLTAAACTPASPAWLSCVPPVELDFAGDVTVPDGAAVLKGPGVVDPMLGKSVELELGEQ